MFDAIRKLMNRRGAPTVWGEEPSGPLTRLDEDKANNFIAAFSNCIVSGNMIGLQQLVSPTITAIETNHHHGVMTKREFDRTGFIGRISYTLINSGKYDAYIITPEKFEQVDDEMIIVRCITSFTYTQGYLRASCLCRETFKIGLENGHAKLCWFSLESI